MREPTIQMKCGCTACCYDILEAGELMEASIAVQYIQYSVRCKLDGNELELQNDEQP